MISKYLFNFLSMSSLIFRFSKFCLRSSNPQSRNQIKITSTLQQSRYSYFDSPYHFHHPLMTPQQHFSNSSTAIHSTTIICVRKNDDVIMMGDGQMTIGNVVAKANGRKLRKLHNKTIICGFAGAAADGIALVDLLEKKLSERDELRRACVETTRLWRTDKILRHLNAILIVADEKSTYQLTGSGELVESDRGIMAIGSGGNYAEAAARALLENYTEESAVFDSALAALSAEDIATKAMKIAADMCIYTNHQTMKLLIRKGEGIVEDTTL